jgi:cell division protein FtsL
MFGISAPRVTVHAAIPWYWRWLGMIVLALVIVIVAHAAYDFGLRFAGFEHGEADRERQQLSTENSRLQQENAELRGSLAQSERQRQIDHVAYDDLGQQVKALSNENASLKEDLAFFETLMPAGGKEDSVTINHFKIENDGLPGEYHYRLLIMQTGRRTNNFQGSLQLVVNLQQDSEKLVMTLPPAGAQDVQSYQLNFRFYQRIDGVFRVTPGAEVKGVQVRVFENGSKDPKLIQTASVS